MTHVAAYCSVCRQVALGARESALVCEGCGQPRLVVPGPNLAATQAALLRQVDSVVEAAAISPCEARQIMDDLQWSMLTNESSAEVFSRMSQRFSLPVESGNLALVLMVLRVCVTARQAVIAPLGRIPEPRREPSWHPYKDVDLFARVKKAPQ